MLKVAEGQSIEFKNVVFKRYCLHQDDMSLAIDNFKELLKKCGATPTGNFFFTIESPLDEKVCNMTFFMTIKEDCFENKTDGEIGFQTYYSVRNLLMMRVLNDYEKLSLAVYGALLAYIVHKELKVCTPFFNVIKKTSDHKYCDVYIGIDPNEKYDYKAYLEGEKAKSKPTLQE